MKRIYVFVFVFLSFSINAQVVSIPDANFLAHLLESSSNNLVAQNLNGEFFAIDSNQDGQIQEIEAAQVTGLHLTSSIGTMESLEGLSAFVNLQKLNASGNNLTSLDLSIFNEMTEFICHFCGLSELTLPQSGLAKLSVFVNNLTSLDFFQNNITELYLGTNQLSGLDLSAMTSNTILDITENPLTDFVPPPSVQHLYVQHTAISELDLTGNTALQHAETYDCPNLQRIFVKTGGEFVPTIFFENCPNLTYICTDESKIVDFQTQASDHGYTNLHINSYCSFVPQGNYITVSGNLTFDGGGNGCDDLDAKLDNVKFRVSDDEHAFDFISGSADFSIYLPESGNYTIRPILENQAAFSISPAEITFDSAIGEDVTQDFCIVATSPITDVEVAVFPFGPARPGFDAQYKILLHNKGNTVQSGQVQFSFPDALLDLVWSTPTVTDNQFGLLTWDFSELQPFERRYFTIELNVNSPVETPAVNNGDTLAFSAVVQGIANDSFVRDNFADLKQLVVGSFDPNDKTCSEGTSAGSEIVGDYIQYTIRFENTGTFAAENVVVRDDIDSSKFDINSLVVLGSSHGFVTRINGNKVEFIFENINLPFGDASNDGFITFKIRTLPTLSVGDVFENSASIYFDYNFPIVTDPAITTITNLGSGEFPSSGTVSLSPNPATETISLHFNDGRSVRNARIYDALGRQVFTALNPLNGTIAVSGLKAGTYIINVTSDTESSTAKFVKR